VTAVDYGSPTDIAIDIVEGDPSTAYFFHSDPNSAVWKLDFSKVILLTNNYI
jgi:hypothetical protein